MKQFLVVLLLLCLACSVRSPSLANKADEAKKAGDFKKAISLYQEHMDRRLEVKNKPEEENPYFYLILIGDCYLSLNEYENAKSKYLEAKEKEVFNQLVSDRIRKIADIKAETKDFDSAINLLREHRELDPLLFDGRIDELHKEMVSYEEEQLNLPSND